MGNVIQLQLEIHIVDFIAAFIVLVGFGIGYNHWVANLEEKGHDRGYMGFIVALGCAVTVLAGFFWPTRNLLVTFVMFLAFVASGTPMILGSVRRYAKKREDDEKKREDDEKTKKLRAFVERFVSEGEPLSESQQTLLEHIVTGVLEIKGGAELVLLAAQQMHDPTYARERGKPEEQQEIVDTIMRGLVKQNQHAQAA